MQVSRLLGFDSHKGAAVAAASDSHKGVAVTAASDSNKGAAVTAASGSRKKSVLQTLRDRQAKIKAREPEKPPRIGAEQKGKRKK